MSTPTRTATVFDALRHLPTTERTDEDTRVTVRLPVDRSITQLAGHYPGFPILPGVLLIDCLRQAAGHACGTDLRLRGIERARFASPLLEGDELELSLLVRTEADGAVGVRARGVRGDGRTAAELVVTLEPVTTDA